MTTFTSDPAVAPAALATAMAHGRPVDARVEIVVPVFNEERALPGCVRTLHAYLTEHMPADWMITVADNASTDATLAVARTLAAELAGVRVVHLDRKGRGLALRTVWAASDADVVAYMDVDLSTGLDALLPLVAPLLTGHSDIAIGSRLAAGSRTVRSTRREVISRAYNGIIRISHGAGFSDAQCGFKAARTEVVVPLLDATSDDSWFFDTELLLLAEYNGLRIQEVPVDWIEDVDSRVSVGSTALDDLRGLVRVAHEKANGSARIAGLPARAAPRPTHPDAVLGRSDLGRRRAGGLTWQAISFAVIGLLSTVATAAAYAALRQVLPVLMANLLALTVMTVANTEANRRWTFSGMRGSPLRAHVQGLVVGAAYYVWTSAALLVLAAVVPDPSRALEVTVLLAASVVGTLARFVLLRTWVFRSPSAPATRAAGGGATGARKKVDA